MLVYKKQYNTNNKLKGVRMVLTIGNWFELEVIPGILSLFRVGLLAIGVAPTKKSKSYLDAYSDGRALYLYALGLEVLISANG
jgi:hypothetical protein